jgi:hypothetical protein
MALPTPDKKDLTAREMAFKNELYNGYKQNKRKFVKNYKGEAEHVMLGRSIKLARKMAQEQDQTKIKDLIKRALAGPLEEIDSASFVQNRKPIVSKPIVNIDKEENPEDVIMMDVPLLIRMLEYAREDAKTDMDLHFAAENLIALCKKGVTLTMDDYDTIITPDEAKND